MHESPNVNAQYIDPTASGHILGGYSTAGKIFPIFFIRLLLSLSCTVICKTKSKISILIFCPYNYLLLIIKTKVRHLIQFLFEFLVSVA